jgi:cytoskeletal protein CcmA (bactofilin family)
MIARIGSGQRPVYDRSAIIAHPPPQPPQVNQMSIFSRKRTEEGTSPMSDAPDPLAPKSNGRPAPAAAPLPPRSVTTPSSPAAGTAPVTIGAAKPPEAAVAPARRLEGHAPMLPTPRRETEQRRLIVGREISLTGEITSCERLIVEGSVEANLSNCREVEIAESGLLKGTAAIEEAEIRGRFEGSLTVRKRLFIKGTGRVTGTIRYGQLEVELGGQVSGDVQVQPGTEEERPSPARPMAVMGSDLKI